MVLLKQRSAIFIFDKLQFRNLVQQIFRFFPPNLLNQSLLNWEDKNETM